MWITLNESISVTGCLATTAQSDLFVITDESGKVYLTKSINLSLKEHVGHKITVSGALGDIDDDDEWTGEYRKNGVKMITVSDLKAISSTCQ
jgi:hypothetical protein